MKTTLTSYQLEYLKEGKKAIQEKLNFSLKVVANQENYQELTIRQAKYDIKALSKLI